MKLTSTQQKVLQAMARGEFIHGGYPAFTRLYRLSPSNVPVRCSTLDALRGKHLIRLTAGITPAGRRALES